MAYDPWRDLRDNWPGIRVVAEPMSGRLLGELRYPVIALRTGTSAAQQRCTLAHELVHLERGLGECGPWAAREERLVHREAARRLVAADALVDAIREGSGTADLAGLARRLDVDCETIRTRLQIVSRTEVARIRAALRALRCAA